MPIHFGKWLRRQIEDTGDTFVVFCERAQIPYPSLMRWLSDKCPPMRGSNIVRLARGLGVPREQVERMLREAKGSSAVAA